MNGIHKDQISGKKDNEDIGKLVKDILSRDTKEIIVSDFLKWIKVKIFKDLKKTYNFTKDSILIIGNLDGVHKGHQSIISLAK